MILRAKYEIEESKDGRSQIIFTEIPYQLTKEPLLKKLAELVNDDRVTGVTDIRDESDRKQPGADRRQGQEGGRSPTSSSTSSVNSHRCKTRSA